MRFFKRMLRQALRRKSEQIIGHYVVLVAKTAASPLVWLVSYSSGETELKYPEFVKQIWRKP